uniref:WGS project CAEQ00000000 data, annotated contig 597 n=1 Tax=Trypanosoma congolense (strain IL3000) TaxID=1068625 RepID=F9WH56_TRYCI|nr:unnamed protein product [Trypanosoma congolense IL3000]
MVLCEPHGIASHPASPVMHDGCCCVVIHRAAGGAGLKADTFASAAEALAFVRASEGCLWVDMQRCSEEDHRQALQLLFPHMQPSHVEAMLASDMYDVVELQPVGDEYVVGCLACSPSHGGPFPAAAATTAAVQAGVDCEEEVLCSFACSERVLLTLHDSLFSGLAELFRYMLNNRRHSVSNTPFVLCALVCHVCEAGLPDPTPLISEVDCIDEIMLLVAPGKRDQTDMLRRVAVLRRRLCSLNRRLNEKGKLLIEMAGPAMRTTFVSRDLRVAEVYRSALEELSQVLSHFECAHDTLNHANLNFMYAVTMRMSQASAGCDYQVMMINKIATICLPAILLASLFGMNCKVPWVADDCDSLLPFWIVVATIVLWMVVLLFKPIRDLLRSEEEEE